MGCERRGMTHQETMKKLTIISCFVLAMCGCMTTSVHNPEYLYQGNDNDITIHLNKDRMIKFIKGNYTVLEADGGLIKGKGKLIVNSSFNYSIKEWEGDITFSEIKSIATTQFNLGNTVGLATGTGLIIYLLWLYGNAWRH